MKRRGIIMTILSALFWLIGLIPIVNIISNIIYWIIWIFSAYKKMHYLKKNPKIILVVAGGIILGFIPFVNWIPWSIGATALSYKMMHTMEMKEKGEQAGKANQQQEYEDEQDRKGQAESDYIQHMEMKQEPEGRTPHSIGAAQQDRYMKTAQRSQPIV